MKNLLPLCKGVAKRRTFWGQRGLAFARGLCSLEGVIHSDCLLLLTTPEAKFLKGVLWVITVV